MPGIETYIYRPRTFGNITSLRNVPPTAFLKRCRKQGDDPSSTAFVSAGRTWECEQTFYRRFRLPFDERPSQRMLLVALLKHRKQEDIGDFLSISVFEWFHVPIYF
jgi:hypothetical protein